MPIATSSRHSAKRTLARAPDDPVTAYARAVVEGQILAGRAVRQAGARHLQDLETGPARGLRWKPTLAVRAIDFFPSVLRLYEGVFAGQPFTLQPWQAFIVGSLFGWLAPDGTRRFRTAYIETGKGSGKTPLLAGLGLYGLVEDGEPGAQIYAAAVTRDQARLLFIDATHMARSSPALARRLEILEHSLFDPASGSVFRPVSSEARALDGKRVHMALIDEIHEHPDAQVIDKMRAGTKGRRQALILEITNSGYDRHSVCWAHHAYSGQILDRVIENDAWFAYICQLDPCEACRAEGRDQPTDGCAECDQWTDPTTWTKVNPNLGISISRRYLEEQVRDALGLPARQNLVKRLNFCLWTESVTRWLSGDAWAACAGLVDAKALREAIRGRRGWLGVDLASTRDLTAVVFVAPDPDGGMTVVPWFWVPADSLRERVARDRVPYDVWARDGWLEVTEGGVVDYAVLRTWLQTFVSQVDLVEVAYDPWNATGLISQLQDDGLTCVPITQGFASLSAPAKALERVVQGGMLRHGGHPILAWCAANVVVRTDPAGNLKPDKARSTERIDGIVACVTALARVIVAPASTSVYAERGLLVL